MTKVYVATPFTSVTGLPSSVLFVRNWTVPVGVPVDPVTVAVRVTLAPALTDIDEAVSAVDEMPVPSDPTPRGVTRFQSLARLLRSTLPQPVTRS